MKKVTDAFVSLFADAGVLFYILFSLTILMLFAEGLTPSFGVLGLGGILTGFGSMASRLITDNITSRQIFLFILYLILIYVAVLLLGRIIIKIRKRIKNKKNFALIEGVKVPLTKEGNPDYSFLVGKDGEVVSDLKPLGKINVDGNIYEATTSKGYIYSGTKIKVDRIMNGRVVVRKKS